MPIYEYVCKECGARFDALRSMQDADAPISCKMCYGRETSRKMSVFSARSGERAVAGSQAGCGGCSGGSCASCHH